MRVVDPEKSIAIERDSTFDYDFSEVLNCVDIQIVGDTLLIMQDEPTSDDPFHFKAYSIETLSYLGSFIPKGRGPGEMVSPNLVRGSSSRELLSIEDNTTSYIVDVKEAIEKIGEGCIVSSEIPSSFLDWLPLSQSSALSLTLDGKEFVFHYIDKSDSVNSKDFHLYKDLKGENYATYLSSFPVEKGDSCNAAVVMIFFPQITFFNVREGKVTAIAVNERYKRWSTIVNSSLGMDTIQYYGEAASSPDYLFALYNGESLGEIARGEAESTIQIFDWQGNYLYEIKTNDDIGDLAYDSKNKRLYCLESRTGGIIRYDMSEIL